MTVSNDNDEVRSIGLEEMTILGNSDFFRLKYRKTRADCTFLNGRSLGFLASPCRAIRLREDRTDLIRAAEQCLQGRDREFRRA